jgi:uncharacterized damage-inducible protein DinB
MSLNPLPLSTLFDGWDGQQTSIVNAVRPLTAAQLAWRPGPVASSAGELARHIAIGRLQWFLRLQPPGGAELASTIAHWHTDRDGGRHIAEDAYTITEDAAALVGWLETSWALINRTLREWTSADLARTYRHTYQGVVYNVSVQWTIYRILTHDVHHGGQLALILGLQGIAVPELGDFFGHLTDPPRADASPPA